MELAGLCVRLDVGVDMDAFGGSNLLMFMGLRSSLVFQCLDLSLPPQGFNFHPLSVAPDFTGYIAHRRQNPKTNGKTTLNSQEYPKPLRLILRRLAWCFRSGGPLPVCRRVFWRTCSILQVEFLMYFLRR